VIVKLRFACAIAVSCVLCITACGTDSDAPLTPEIGRTTESTVSEDITTRAIDPVSIQQNTEDKPLEVQRPSTIAPPSLLEQTSANPAVSADASDYQLLLLALAYNDEIEALFGMYRYEDALEKLDAAAGEPIGDFDAARALYLRGVATSRLGRYTEAAVMLSRLIEDGKLVADALAELGHLYFLAGDIANATAYLEQAVNYQPAFGLKYRASHYRGLLRLSVSDYE
jgi:tetratricopeptide (TPR) repeat protein